MDGAGNPNVPQGERPPTAPPVNWGRRRKKFGGNLGVLEKCISSPNMGAHATVAPSSGTAGVSVDNGENYAPEYADMEAWLDEHPEFTKDYFIRKASRQMVDLWLLTHAIPMTLPLEVSPAEPTLEEHVHVGMISGVGSAASLEEQEEESGGDALDQSDLPSSSVGGASSLGERKQGSGATTPVRKISATEFEKGGLLTPIVNTVDGCPTFISQPLPDMTSAQVQEGRMRRKSRAELKALDEKELIFELVKDICRDLDVVSLCHKILQNVGTLTNANRCSLFLVKGEGHRKHLVSTLFDVSSGSTIEETQGRQEIVVPWGTGIVGYVAETGESLNIPDAYKDSRFNDEVDQRTGFRTRSVLCLPILDLSGSEESVIGVAMVINKMGGQCFTKNDEKVFRDYLQFCGIGLRNAQLYERSQLENRRNQVLLDLARITFQEQSTIETIVSRIMIHMQSLLQAERCQVLLTHEASKASFSRVFDLEVQEDPASETYSRSVAYENRTPLNVGVTGHVASTGETVNIADASGDERCDQHSGLVMKHILSMPIKNAINQIIGVVQLINKLPPGNESGFTKNDEHFLEAFAIFCGMGLHNTQMYERAVIAVAKQEVTLEVLSYHATAPQEDVLKLMRAKVPSGQFFRLHDFKFDDYGLYEDDTLKACLRMFMDLDLIERFNIDRQVLCRWLLSIRRNYRPVIYHNWRHAFSVAQMMFAILLSTQWWKGLGDLDCLALLIACLSHDLDHRGTNNSFQVKMSSPLAQMYTTSILEHHHFDQCVMILNSQGNQILSHLRPDEYKTVVTIIEEAILATDLANFFKNKGKFAELVESEKFNWADPEHRFLLRAMTMTACDIGAITKPWSTQKRVAELVAGEFFEQGDLEKEKLNITPIDMMNREKRDRLPELQVEFIDVICLPVYEALCKLSPALQPLLSGVQNNRMRWKTMADAVIVSAEKHKKANGTGTGIKTATTTSSS